MISSLTENILEACNRAIPRKKAFPNRPTWWTDKLDKLRKQLNKKKRTYLNSANHQDREINHNLYNEAKQIYSESINRTRDKAWTKFAVNDLARNPWGTIYQLASSKKALPTPITAIRTPTGYTSDINSTIANTLSAIIPDDDPNTDNPANTYTRRSSSSAYTQRSFNLQIDEDLVFKLHKGICNNKAPGPDNIPGKVLNLAAHLLTPPLTTIFQSCLDLNYFPGSWKTGKLIIFPTSPDKDLTDPKSYRPITLLSELGKIFERIIHHHIHLDPPAPLHNPAQFGFIPRRSTSMALHHLLNTIKDSPDKLAAAVFLDIAGAFDNVWWPAVINRLYELNTNNNIIQLIRSYFSNRRTTYSTSHSSSSKLLTKGCPQGSVLGPLIWNLVMDQLLEKQLPPGCNAIAYADDIVITISAKSRQ